MVICAQPKLIHDIGFDKIGMKMINSNINDGYNALSDQIL